MRLTPRLEIDWKFWALGVSAERHPYCRAIAFGAAVGPVTVYVVVEWGEE